ncbi:hypothetical protein LINGRAPRIM_LOCUS3057 [Linum grandiflorum]
MEENAALPNAWTQRFNSLFDEYRNQDGWYVADSDSEDVAEAPREEDDEVNEEEEDPLCSQVCFTAEEKTHFRRPWRSALVVKGLDRKIPYLPLARRLNSLWAKHGNIQISDLENDCYLVRFRSQEDYEWAITGGPWRCAVMRIASRIGKLVRVDRATEAGARGKYARVCVEVDLSKRLLPKYKVEGVLYLIVYAGFHKICTKCGMYGTPTHLCKFDHPQVEDMMTNDTEQVHKVCDLSNGQVLGEWMMPKKKAWRRTKEVPISVNKPQSTKPITQGNRFDVLKNNEDNVPTASPAISQGGKK